LATNRLSAASAGEDAAVVLVNRNETSKSVTLEVEGLLPSGASFRDIFTGTIYTIPSVHRALEWVAVPANGVTVLVLNDATLAAPPEAVTDLAVTDVNPGTVYLDWSNTTGADEYIVFRSCLSGGGYELIGTSATSDYIDTGVTVGTRYYYIVIARNTTNGLVSGPSNEVDALPAYAIQWANLQWPPTITHTIGITPTENIYGQVWIDGVTLHPGQTPTLSAQVGFGPDGSLPLETQPGSGQTQSIMSTSAKTMNSKARCCPKRSAFTIMPIVTPPQLEKAGPTRTWIARVMATLLTKRVA